MPTVKNIPGPYRLYFYSFDCNEPKHVYVQREKKICKFWLEPLSLSKNTGFPSVELNSIRRTIENNLSKVSEAWDLSIVASNADPRLSDFRVTNDEISAYMVDGRTISVPLAWSWRLSEATEDQRNNFEILGDGQGVHWPEIDEDISVEGMLSGVPAPRLAKTARKAA
jgi:hypothetical protein